MEQNLPQNKKLFELNRFLKMGNFVLQSACLHLLAVLPLHETNKLLLMSAHQGGGGALEVTFIVVSLSTITVFSPLALTRSRSLRLLQEPVGIYIALLSDHYTRNISNGPHNTFSAKSRLQTFRLFLFLLHSNTISVLYTIE